MQRNTSTRQEGSSASRIAPLGHGLRSLTRVAARWPRFAMALVILATCVSAGYTFFFLRFQADRGQFIDPTAEHHKRWTAIRSTFEHSSDVTVVVEAANSGEVTRILDELADRLRQEPNHFTNILHRIDGGALQHKWLQFVRPQYLQAGLRKISEYSPLMRGDTSRIELAGLFTRLGNQIDTRMAEAETKPLAPSEENRLLRQAEMLAGSLQHSLDSPNDFHSPWPELVPLDTQTRGIRQSYFLNDRGTMGYLRVVPRQDESDASGEWPALARLEEIDAEVAEAHPGCKIGLTGVGVLEHSEIRRSRIDLAWAALIAIGACLAIMAVGLRGVRHPMLTLVMLAAGIIWSLGFTTAVVGHLNVLSLAVVAILFGLGMDFAIAYLSKYLQLRREGWQLRPALMETTGTTGAASMTAAITTALAFLCTLLTDFVGVAELGIVAAAGILLCALSVFFILPGLISLSDRNADPRALPKPFEGKWLRRGLARYPVVTLALSMAVLVGLGLQIVKIQHRQLAWRVRFDGNVLNLHDKNDDAVRLENRLFNESSRSLLFAVSTADSERQMRELHAKLERLPSVGHVESLALRLPSSQNDSTRQLMAQYRSQLAYLPGQVPAMPPADPSVIGKAIDKFYTRIKKYGNNERVRQLAQITDTFLNRFEKLTLEEQTQFLNQFQYRMAADLLNRMQTVRYAASDEQINVNDLPSELVNRFVTPQDAEGKRKWLLQIYPKEKIWDEAPLAKFISELRTVDPNVAGSPIQNFEAVRQIRHSYETAALYAFAVVWVVLLIDFLSRDSRWMVLIPTLLVTVVAAVMLHARRIPVDPMLFAFSYVVITGAIALVMDARNLRNAALAFSVPIAGGIAMFGVFAVAHVDLNPANLLVLPLVLGLGINYGVHVVQDYRSQKGAYEMSPSVFSTIVLTALTSMAGFGSLMVASHRGLFSLGLALSIGIGSCLFISLALLPAMLSVLSKRESGLQASNRSEPQSPKRAEAERKRAA